jgi:uncharacterized protein (DUF1501 family)
MKRKEFLKQAALLATVPVMIDALAVKPLKSLGIFDQLAAAATDTDHVLVIINMVGGNDGLNTLVPLDQYSNLQAARSKVLIPQNKLMKVTGFDSLGWHPSFDGMRQLFADGRAMVVQDVGYANQNYSHFRSSDIWMSGSDSDETWASGLAGRYLNSEYPNFPVGYPNTEMPDPLGIQIGSVMSLLMQGPAGSLGMAITNPNDVFNLVTGINDPEPASYPGMKLKYVRGQAKQTADYTTVINAAAVKGTNKVTYPAGNYLAEQLKIVARLISGGLKTRIYIVSLGGFDTHSVQTDAVSKETGVHANLLKQVGDAAKAFMDDCKQLGTEDRVLGITTSEFGRRIKSNDSNGTDHGAASPMFIFGKNLKGSTVIGHNPVIPNNVGVDDNLPHQHDFRSIYSTIFQDWFCLSPSETQAIMQNAYSRLDIIKTSCAALGSRTLHARLGENILRPYPNPFVEKFRVDFETAGGYTMIQLMDYSGRIIATLCNDTRPAGQYTIDFNAELLASGNYYLRLQNNDIQQVKGLVKVR